MDAPPGRMSPDDFQRVLDEHVVAHFEKGDGGYKCKRCGAVIKRVTGYASVHSAEFGDTCAGGGNVRQFPLPYCPNCEGEPKQTATCVHVHMFIPTRSAAAV